jgi:CO/xanthine dehydrogenase FAD-binding subunit
LRSFHYVRPSTIDHVVSLLSEHGPEAILLAGGTDLLVRLRMGHLRPRVVIDLKQVSALRSDIVESGRVLRIGALAVMRDIIRDPKVRRHFPALVEAARVVGSVQIRNRATLAGNICNASPAADTAPALLVYGALVTLVSAGGARTVAAEDFFLGPGRTVMRRGEIVESIDLPLPEASVGAAFGRLTRRRGVDLATINLCCLVKATGETLFAYGACAPKPFLVRDDSGTLEAASAVEIDLALDRLISAARPVTDVRGSREYRLAMLKVMSRRALVTALERLRISEGGL